MEADRHPKEELHDAIAASLQFPEISPGLEGSVLTRWVLVAEVMLPDERRGLAEVSSSAGNLELSTWDRAGFYVTALFRSLRRSA